MFRMCLLLLFIAHVAGAAEKCDAYHGTWMQTHFNGQEATDNMNLVILTKDDYLGLAPELVVEIVWQERPIDEINKLIPVAMSNGCEAFWIVDPAQKSVLDVRADTTRRNDPSDELRLPKPWSECSVRAGTLFQGLETPPRGESQ